MNIKKQTITSRRRFIETVGLSSSVVPLFPRRLSAKDDGIVPTMVRAAANAKITVQPLRRNISVLEGSGGNIAVLTGRDGKLLIDAGITASRPRITEALGSLSGGPVKHLINSHWHFDHTDGN